MNTYMIEVTDTFAGEVNFSWVARHEITAKSFRGAVNKFSRMSGIKWHIVDNFYDYKRYDSKSGSTCFFH